MVARRIPGSRTVIRLVLVALTTAGIIALLGLVAHPAPFTLFFPAVLASGWWWGRRPALLCVALCALASGYLWTSGTGFRLNPIDVIDLTSFILVGTILAFMSAGFRDARRRAEAARRQLARFLESTGDAFMAFDREWHYMYVNPRAAQFARLPAESMVGRSLLELFPDITTGRFFQAAERVMREGLPISVDSYYPPLDTWFENDIYPVDDGIGVFYRDVTARKRASELAEELLRREQIARSESDTANRVKDEFLATLSHELRTPLNAILGWTSLLGSGRLTAPDTTRAVETIERNARAQAQLIEDLLDVSRIIAGKLRLGCAAGRPAGRCSTPRSTRCGRQRDAKEHAASTSRSSPRPRVVAGDPPRLQQVVWNLLSNAIKFTPTGGRVQVTLLRVDSQAELTVARHRHRHRARSSCPHLRPLPPGRQHVDPRASRPRARPGDRAPPRRAARRHRVRREPRRGPGSDVHGLSAAARPRLRIRQEDDTRPRAASGLAAAGDWNVLRNVDVLVVDDDHDAAELMVRMLDGMGARSRSVSSAREAMVELDRQAPDVLLSDIEMPGEDGYALIRSLRGRADGIARLPVVAVTAYARDDDRARALREGFDNHIAKPVDPPELAAAVTMALRSRKGRGIGAPRFSAE